MSNPLVFVAMFHTVFRINILPRINFYFEFVITGFERTVHHHGDHFGITVFESLVFNIDVFGFCPFADTVSVLPVLRTILGDVYPEENFPATRILAFFLAQFLPTSGFWQLHRKKISSQKMLIYVYPYK